VPHAHRPANAATVVEAYTHLSAGIAASSSSLSVQSAAQAGGWLFQFKSAWVSSASPRRYVINTPMTYW
jgi:hypothetical protein